MLISASELTASPGKSGHLGPLVAKMRDVLLGVDHNVVVVAVDPHNVWIRPFGRSVEIVAKFLP